MKKSDLKQGNVLTTEKEAYILIGDKLIGYKRSKTLDDYTEDLTSKLNDGDDIIIVSKGIKNITINSIQSTYHYDSINVLWKKEKEIDWSKVPENTKVQVREDWSVYEWKNRYFRRYAERGTIKPYETTNILKDDFTKTDVGLIEWWSECRIHPSVEIKEEWYKVWL